MEKLKRWLQAPAFADDEKTKTAYLLNAFLSIAAVLLILLMSIFATLPQLRPRLSILLIFFIITSIAIITLKKGWVKQTAWLYCGSLFVVLFYASFTSVGVSTPAFGANILIVVLAGVLLGVPAAVGFAVATTIAGFFLLIAEQNDWLLRQYEPTAVNAWLLISVYCFMAIVVVFLANKNISKALQKSNQEIKTRRQIEEALRASEQQYRTVLDGVDDVIYVLDINGIITTLSPAFTRITGWPTDAWIGKRFTPIIHPDDRSSMNQILMSVIQGEEVSTKSEVRIQSKTGGYITFDLNVTKGILENDVINLFGIARDVTARKQTEALIQQAQRLDSLGLLAGGVAHDFNNLLVGILAQASLALYKLPPDNPARRPIEKSVNAAKRAAELTRQLLAFSGRGQFDVRVINFNNLIRENLHLFEIAVPAKVSLSMELASDLPNVEADVGQMQQVIMNLIINAVQAIDEEVGRVTIVTDQQMVSAADVAYWQQTGQPLAPGKFVTVEVHDTGCGMDEETQARIFDPFFSTKDSGHGLGLAAVLGIMRGHHGGIRVYSEVDKGTTFKLLFPVTTELFEQVVVVPDVPFTGEALVLVVDDEEAVRQAVHDILLSQGIEVLLAGSGEAGLQLLRERGKDIHLVLLDLTMPGLSGEETFRQMRQLQPQMPVILSSGYNEIEATQRFVGKGLAGFLQKPYSRNALLEKVREYL